MPSIFDIGVDVCSDQYAGDMDQIVGDIIGGLALIAIPLVAWGSRRATSEGRKLLRVERLGNIYSVMPAGPDKAEFEKHVVRAIQNVNAWIDIDTVNRRILMRLLAVVTFLAGVACAIWVTTIPGPNVDDWFKFGTGIVFGSLIAIVNFISSTLLERRALAQRTSAQLRASGAHEEARRLAFKNGEQMPATEDA